MTQEELFMMETYNPSYNLQPNIHQRLEDIPDKNNKLLIISADVLIQSRNELLERVVRRNINLQLTTHLTTISQQAFSKSFLRPAIELGLLTMLFPDKPNSKKQKYHLTEKGLMILKEIKEQLGSIGFEI